ncbi:MULTISPECIES: FAD-dependent oxidoreductase [Subtercola]|uniref:FAD-dependent oxidoreductase n=1 Tax=Subtercola TaxID=120212 RepID=UPI001F199869|nr:MULTISPECIES: FAD-dependent oxidoreductase [Subtercola]MEA9984579.1 NAD(P)-binding domain-containing protein [Subtercola sp. RTI3]
MPEPTAAEQPPSAASPGPHAHPSPHPDRAGRPATLPRSARVVIVGAGQAGLSVAYHLRRRGLTPGTDLVLLDRGPGAGGAWQFRWESLRLGTAHRVNDLPGMSELGLSFDTADHGRAARDVVGEYYRRYEEFFGLAVFRPVEVTSVTDAPDESRRLRIHVSTDRDTIDTDVLVNASGTWATPFRPYYPGAETFAGEQIGTPQFRDAQHFAGKRVIVVGGGTSATGFVLELEGIAAHTTWVTRRPVEFVDDDKNLEGRLAAVAEQDEAARAGRVLPSIISGTGLPATERNRAAVARGTLVARPPFSRIESGGVHFADGSFEPADAIIWATGFRAELSHLAPLKLREQSGGVAVERGRSLRDPRVFLAGYGPQASTIGANRAGRLVALQVLDALQHPGHPEPA